MKRIILSISLAICLTAYGQDHQQKDYLTNEKYALVIGISKYEISSNDLRFAQKDADDFSKALISYGGFKKENTKLLVNSDASRENIRKNIEGWLKDKASKNDLVIIFFSGHGAQIPDTDGDEDDGLDESLVPYDFDGLDYSSLINDDTFAYWVRNLASERILIIFDNCFSGGTGKQKGVRLPGVKGDIGSDDFMKDISRELPKKGTALLAASKATQVSFESSEYKNGVFTHFLLNSINASSDNDLNGIISARELFYATKQKTLEYSKNIFKREQEPIFLDLLVDDLEIFNLPKTKQVTTEVEDTKIKQLEYQAKEENDDKKQLAIYNQLHQLKPNNASYIFDIALINERLGKRDDAIEAYKSILLIKNSNYGFSPSIAFSLSKLYEKKGDVDQAITYLNMAIKDEPCSPVLYNAIANLYLSKKDTMSAIQNLNKSLSIQPLQKEPYLKSFFLNINRGSFDIANKLISDCFSINPSDFTTQYCYYLSQKYISSKDVVDSVFLTIENNSGIKKRMSEILKNVDNITYIYNNRTLTKQEARLQTLKDAISDYYYYPEFYKLFIKYVVDNKIQLDIDVYKKRYLFYSRLNPDNNFIGKYLGNQ